MSTEQLQESARNQLFRLHMSWIKYIVLIDNNDLIERFLLTRKEDTQCILKMN